MIRAIFLAAFLISAVPAIAADNTPLQEFHLLSLERAKLAAKLREVVAFKSFYQKKKQKLEPEAKRLRAEQEDIMLMKRRVDAKCQPPVKKGRRPAQEAAEKCADATASFQERVAKYTADHKQLQSEYATIDNDERIRQETEIATSAGLEEALKLLAKLEALVPASKQKDCIIACNGQGHDAQATGEQCLQQCAVTP